MKGPVTKECQMSVRNLDKLFKPGSLALIGATPRRRRIGELVGEVLRENTAMLQMCRALGFTISVDPQDPGLVRVSKVLQPQEAPAG